MGRTRSKGRARSTRVSFDSGGVEGFDGGAGGIVAGGPWVWGRADGGVSGVSIPSFLFQSDVDLYFGEVKNL
jgi:hypothetical protein